MDTELNIGDIVLDTTNGDIGVLISRYTLLEYWENNKGLNVWAWDIFWVGPFSGNMDKNQRLQPYTESGLVNLIKSKTFLLNPSLDNYG